MGYLCHTIRVGVVLSAVAVLLWQGEGFAIPLDKDREINLGARVYVNARIGTENTHTGETPGTGPVDELIYLVNGTFPRSSAGHLRQNRLFVEAELKHKLDRLVKEGVGPFSLLNDLPFRIKKLSYQVTFRGEGEGLYDWGPKEYSTAREFYKLAAAAYPIEGPLPGQSLIRNQGVLDVPALRRQVRDHGVHRERLFQAFIDTQVGPLFLRFGRQLLSWGETDGFQLLDHINPLDNSFGGFLIDLDERRVPLDMLRADYYLGNFGPISEAFLQAYAAIDDEVGYLPIPPWGSPWLPPGLGAPVLNVTTPMLRDKARTINNTRGGGLLKFNMFDATFSLAHYYTYFDVPAVQVVTNPRLFDAFNDGLACPNDPTQKTCGAPTRTIASAPKVQVSGITTTFAVPQFYSIVRSELAYFKDEAAFTQGQLDPFIFNLDGDNFARAGKATTGGRRLRDSINFVLGVDMNQWVRVLNPNQTFLFSTQFFYKHIKNAGDGKMFLDNCNPLQRVCLNPNREVLPVPAGKPYGLPGFLNTTKLGQTFITQPADQFLQTLLVTTSYASGKINPFFLMFYDWGGGFVYMPSVIFSRDPFRFAVSYSIIDSHSYKGGSGVSLLKDRDNVEFRFEYVI